MGTKTLEVFLCPTFQVLAVAFLPIMELLLSEHLQHGLVLTKGYLDEGSAEDVDDTERKELRPEVIEQVDEKTGNM